MPGPFHRLESPTQTPADANQQLLSHEIWGRSARGSDIPSVKAYRGKLPSSVDRGVEFESDAHPTRGSGTPYEARWYVGTADVIQRARNGEDYAVIRWTSFIHNQH